MRFTLKLGSEEYPVALLRHDDGGRIWIGDEQHEASIGAGDTGEHVVVVDGDAYWVWVAQHGEPRGYTPLAARGK